MPDHLSLTIRRRVTRFVAPTMCSSPLLGRPVNPGLHGLPPELCKVFATDLAAWLHPIYMKIAWRGSEPTGWKGESSVYFYKNRGRHDDCAAYRSVLLLSTWAKACHKCLRAPLKRHFERATPALQLGGKSGCSVTFGSHLARTVVRCAAAQNLASLVIFAEIASSFYVAVTQLVARSRDVTTERHFAALALTSKSAQASWRPSVGIWRVTLSW